MLQSEFACLTSFLPNSCRPKPPSTTHCRWPAKDDFAAPHFFIDQPSVVQASRRHRAGLFPSLLADLKSPVAGFGNCAHFDYRPCPRLLLAFPYVLKWCATGPTNPHTRFVPGGSVFRAK